MKKAINLIESLNIEENSYIVIGCSYGPDSMVLLDILKKFNYNIVIAHINHNVREESNHEEKKLRAYARKHKILFETTKLGKHKIGNFEEKARNYRYKFYRKVLKKYNSKYLFTGHHGDDLVETILMRLMRGASFSGYKGFDAVVNMHNHFIVRPLYYYSKEDILNYANRNNVPFAHDHTNFENTYTRNKVRNNILPFLKEENQNIHEKFISFNKMINEYDLVFTKETDIILDKAYNGYINLNEFLKYDYLYQKRILEKILLKKYKKNIKLIGTKHVDFIFNLIYSMKPNGYIYLPLNKKIIKEYNKLYIDDDIKVKPYNKTLYDNLIVGNNKFYRDDSNKDGNTNLIRLKVDEISMPLKIRTRKEGDLIKPINFNGRKKLKSLFIDNKIPLRERDKYPILVDSDDNILWVVNLSKSKYHKQKNEDYDIIIKHEKKEND